MAIPHENTKVCKSKWFKDAYQVREIVVDIRQRWTDDITEWTGMKINKVAAAAEDCDCWRGILHVAYPSSYEGRH